MLIANARPIVIKPLAAIPDNVTVISAASGAQIRVLEEKSMVSLPIIC